MRVSVSKLDLYLSWKLREEQDFAWLVAALKDNTPTEPMLRGRAFARALERASEGESAYIVQDGYTFAFTGDFTIEHFPRREESREKDYGGIVVSARCDHVLGPMVRDDKTTGNFGRNDTGMDGSERYMAKYQWRYYLDIFEADRFVWDVWEVKEINNDAPADSPMFGTKAINVHAHHRLEQYRYPHLHHDCTEVAQEYKYFAERYLI